MSNPAHKLETEIGNATDLRALLEANDYDEEAVLLSIESETDLTEAIQAVDASLLEDETQLAGLDHTIGRLEARAGRHRARMAGKRAVMLKAMDRAGLKTVKGITGTLSLTRTSRKLVLFEEDAVPAEYWTEQKPKLDKAAVKKTLVDGGNVVGAMLDNGSIALTIRRS